MNADTIIVSLTSYPKRIFSIRDTIDSLMNQTYNNFVIVLYLASEEFINTKKIEEQFSYVDSSRFSIRWVDENIRSYKKIYYALQEYPDNIIVTVDDDIKYSDTMLTELMLGHVCHPGCVIGRRVHQITRNGNKVEQYDKWVGECVKYVNEPRLDLIATGVGGILYPPHIFDNEVFDKNCFMDICPSGDDLWLKTMELRSGISTVYVGGNEADIEIESMIGTGLCFTDNAKDGNDKQIDKLLEKFKSELQRKIRISDLQKTQSAYKESRYFDMNELDKIINGYTKEKQCYLYGAGHYGKLLLDYFILRNKACCIRGVLVNSCKDNPDDLDGFKVIDYHTLPELDCDIIIALAYEKQEQIHKELSEYGFDNRRIVKLSKRNLFTLDNKEFKSSIYWEDRYKMGGNSGAGSYNRLAEYKAEIINGFVIDKGINSVIEWGCGDGNQLAYFRFPSYIGFDVSQKAIEIISKKYKNDDTKTFIYCGEESFINNTTADLSMSLDVIYHLVEDEVYEKYMHNLFESSKKYVCIYAGDFDEDLAIHVKSRKFTDYVNTHYKQWKLIWHEENRYPYSKDNPDNTSFSDFYFYEKV